MYVCERIVRIVLRHRDVIHFLASAVGFMTRRTQGGGGGNPGIKNFKPPKILPTSSPEYPSPCGTAQENSFFDFAKWGLANTAVFPRYFPAKLYFLCGEKQGKTAVFEG